MSRHEDLKQIQFERDLAKIKASPGGQIAARKDKEAAEGAKKTDAALLLRARKMRAKALINAHGVPLTRTDSTTYSECNDSGEVAWIAAGGDLATWRALCDLDPEKGAAGMASLEGSLGIVKTVAVEVAVEPKAASTNESLVQECRRKHAELVELESQLLAEQQAERTNGRSEERSRRIGTLEAGVSSRKITLSCLERHGVKPVL